MANGIIELNASFISTGNAVGKKEFEGPLGSLFDIHDTTDRFGMETWEKAESEMQRLAFNMALKKAGIGFEDIGALFAGDLLNQCVGSSYGLLEYDIPYLGLYGACSTAAESLLLSALMASAGNGRFAAVASSHNAAAERQFRSPVDYGGQRTPTAQWTVTGAAAFLVEEGSCAELPKIRSVHVGRSLDSGTDEWCGY